MKLNTTYYTKGKLVENRIEIAKNYYNTRSLHLILFLGLIYDIIVLIPYFIALKYHIRYIDIMILIKILFVSDYTDPFFDRL